VGGVTFRATIGARLLVVAAVVALWGAGLGACTAKSQPASCSGYVCGFYTGEAGSTGSVDAALVPTAAADPDAVLKSEGCGKVLPANQPKTVPGTPTGYLQYHVMQTGATLAGMDATRAGDRTFWVRVPADYDPNRAYRLVYVNFGCGGLGQANVDTYPLYDESQGGTEEAIYVAVDISADMANEDCLDTRAGLGSQEWEAFSLFQGVVDANYCVDDNRIFVDSFGDDGASLANMWGCYFAGSPTPPRLFAPTRHIRGQSSVSGGDPSNNPTCGGPVAALWIHDISDTGDPISTDIEALDRVLKGNGCQGDHTSSPTAAWTPMPDVCLQYTSCPADYPVVFCTTTGMGHLSQTDREVPAFTAFADMLPPPSGGASTDGGSLEADVSPQD
jgi:hypothetical protein